MTTSNNTKNERNEDTSGSSQRPEITSETSEDRAEDARPGGSASNRSRSRWSSTTHPYQDESSLRRHRAGEVQSRLAAYSFRNRRIPTASSKSRQVSYHSATADFSPIPGRHSFPRLELATLEALEVASELTSASSRYNTRD
jgi:hypothetical protein